MKDSDIEHKFVTIPKAVEILKRIDNDCMVSTYLLRRAVNEKKILCSKSGVRIYVDLQTVYEYLKGNIGDINRPQ